MEGFIITNQVRAQNDFQNSSYICEITYKYETIVMSVINHRLYL